MGFEVIRMPKGEEAFSKVFNELQPFLASMYTKNDVEIHGPEAFFMEQWIFLWDMGHGLLLVNRNDDNSIRAVSMCIKNRDLWYNKEKMDIYRYAFAKGTNPPDEVEAMAEYLIGNSTLLEFDELYITKRGVEGELRGCEIKELKWQASR